MSVVYCVGFLMDLSDWRNKKKKKKTTFGQDALHLKSAGKIWVRFSLLRPSHPRQQKSLVVGGKVRLSSASSCRRTPSASLSWTDRAWMKTESLIISKWFINKNYLCHHPLNVTLWRLEGLNKDAVRRELLLARGPNMRWQQITVTNGVCAKRSI